MPINTMLVLFDIDGTLIKAKEPFLFATARFSATIKEVFGIDTTFSQDRYNGAIQKYILWNMARRGNIRRSEFEKHYEKLTQIEYAHLKKQ